ncbi:hypothetical protein OUN72_002822 [Salmonella enterica subsp. enterica serovar Essen]|nr:hypothetical protein [Salmonella enterica]
MASKSQPKLKPLSPAQRQVVKKLAAVMVCVELEVNVVASVAEKATGKPYDHAAPDSYLNTFLNKNPEYKRLWSLMQKDIAACRKNFAASLEARRDK